MKDTISVDFPQSLAQSLKLKSKEFKSEMKTSSLVKLFELGKISSGVAAKVLGISRLDFFELLGKYNVSVIDYDDLDDLRKEIENA